MRRRCAWLTKQRSVSGLLMSVLAHGKAVQSSEPLFFGPLKIGLIVLRQNGRQQRDWQQLNGLQSGWPRSCWQLRLLLLTLQRRALGMSAERAAKLRCKETFGRRLRQAGAVEAVEVVVGMRHRHHRHRRHRHRRHRHHSRHHHRVIR